MLWVMVMKRVDQTRGLQPMYGNDDPGKIYIVP